MTDLTDGGVPLGFGMTLAQNTEALEAFARLPERRRRDIIAGAGAVSSKEEMRSYVDGILNESF